MSSYFASGNLRGELITLELCQVYGWTYQEFYSQPQWFIDLAIEKLKVDRKRATQ